MENEKATMITIESSIHAPVKKVWAYWTEPAHIVKWNAASDDWHTIRAENDLRTGGKFSSRMEAKDGSMGFDFGGIYDLVKEHAFIESMLGDGRKMKVVFTPNGDSTHVSESFEPEKMNAIEMQRAGWQAILDNFKKYTEESE